MVFYLILIGLPVGGLLLRPFVCDKVNNLLWLLISCFWVFLIGFRHEVGCDWEGYATLYESISYQFTHYTELTSLQPPKSPILEAIFSNAPGYRLLNWLSVTAGTGIYGVNTICALVLVFGLASLCRKTSISWLAWYIATPYFLIVVSMGYTRQATAIGILIWVITSFKKPKLVLPLILVVLAASIHSWAALIGSIILVSRLQMRWQIAVKYSLIIFFVCCLWLYLTGIDIYSYAVNYRETISYGGLLRIFVQSIPSFILLVLCVRRTSTIQTEPIWIWYSAISVLSIPFTFIASTAIDRMLLYLYPLQIVAWPHIVQLIAQPKLKLCAVILLCLFYLAIFVVWFTLSDHSHCWSPYLNILT